MAEPRADFRLPPVMAHRGAAAHAPENTLAAVRKTAAGGITWIEFDVMLTGDGVPVLFHDDCLERITGRDALMAATRYADLDGLDAGSWFDPAFAGEPVPSLAAALELFLEAGLHPNIEIKPTPGRDVETAVAALEVVRGIWPRDRPGPLVSSFSRMSLAAARALAPAWPRALIAWEVPTDWQTALQALGCAAFHVSEAALGWETISLIKTAGYEVAAFTVNDPERAVELFGSGIDCVISDDPERMLSAYQDSRKAPTAK
jgi:glycerophosphoryl diester phosphodiesterase